MPRADAGPLTGIRVVDLSIWIQGPIAATLLADLGADVIKLEKAGGGDFSRNLTGINGVALQQDGRANLMWAMCNRNKRTLTLDLHRETAAPVFRSLIQSADVFLTNLHPAALRQFGATEEAVRAMNPRIIYARAAGLGERGPRAEDPCQDTVGMAYSGFMWTCANTTEAPYYPPGAMADVLSGTMLAFGVLAALQERTRTGEGQHVSSSQLQSLLWFQYLNTGVAANYGQQFTPSDRAHPAVPMVNTYRCGDGRWIALGLILETHWPPFCEAVGLGHLRDDERFGSIGGRMRNAPELARIIEGNFLQRPADHWLGAMRERGLWVSPVNTIGDLVAGDPQVEANGYLLADDNGLRMPVPPFTIDSTTPGTAPAPDYGQHTDEILRELGLDEESVLALKVDGAVW